MSGRRLAALLIVLSILVLMSGAQASRYDLALNGNGGGMTGVPAPASLPAAARWRPIELNPRIASAHGLALGDTLDLNLFKETSLKAKIDRVSANVNGTITVRGRIEGYPMGAVLISTTGKRTLGCITIPETGKRYFVQDDPATGVHYALEPAMSGMRALEGGPALVPEQSAASTGPNTVTGSPSDPANIDVMVVYTPAARQWAYPNGGIENVIAQSMAQSQLALDNSVVGVTMTLVYSHEVSYTEAGTAQTDLSRLTDTTDGYMDEIHGWRDQNKADLVSLFASIQDVGGLAWQLDSTGGSPSGGFSVCRVAQAGWTTTQVHEMGHNIGCHHHKNQNVQPGPGIFSYSAGWRWTGSRGTAYCSVMTYEDGRYFSDGITATRVPYFSSPSVSHQGVPTGHAANGDNARTLRELKHVVAIYRADQVAAPTFTPDGGVYRALQEITIRCATPGAEIHYTTNGADPTESDPVVALGGTVTIYVNPETTLKARAFKTGWAPSEVKSGFYAEYMETEIGTGYYQWVIPMHTAYKRSRTQTIYLASEIGDARRIRGLCLNVQAIPGRAINRFTIRLKHTPLSSYSPVLWESTGWTTCYQSDVTISSTGWAAFMFSAPFDYNGTDNLMVDFSFYNDATSAASGYCTWSAVEEHRTAYVSSTSGDPLTWSGTSPGIFAEESIPNIRLRTEDIPTLLTIPAVKESNDGRAVKIEDAFVSASTNRYTYVQNEDRSTGIRVKRTASPLSLGARTRVTGIVRTNADGERYIDLFSLQIMSEPIVPDPVGLPLRSLGGSGRPSPGQQAVRDGAGLSNIGLLVRTWGKVTGKGAGYLYLDDGAGLRDGTLTGTEENVGVRVVCDPSACQAGDYASVTGISSCFETGSGPARCILPQGASGVAKILR